MHSRRLCAVLAGALLAMTEMSPAAAEQRDGPPDPAPVYAELGADGVQRATLILDSYSYAPAHLVVRVGRPVQLTLTSVTTLVPHNFILRDGGLSLEQDVASGKSFVLHFTPTQTGSFPFYCDKQLLFFKSHRERGMEGLLDVRS